MSYDVFLSHTHADKAWTRGLHDDLTSADYRGRPLRAWLDEQVLDPGDPSSNRELESALDRSRFLLVVLSLEALGSRWVNDEIDYFLETKQAADIVLVRRRRCPVPTRLADVEVIEWPDGAAGDQPRSRLLEILRPSVGGGYDDYRHGRSIRGAWMNARAQQPAGFDPAPTAANTALLDILLSYDIGELAEEGPALLGFERIGQLHRELDATEGYTLKMVLAEFLAVAVMRDTRYSQVMSNLVRQDLRAQQRPSFLTLRNRALRNSTGPASTTNLLLSVARAYSKLGEVDVARVDLSTLAAILHALDQRGGLSNDERTVAVMIGRTLGKLRSTLPAGVLIHALANSGGNASHLAAATAISTGYDDLDGPVFFTRELADLTSDRASGAMVEPPSLSLARLLPEPRPVPVPARLENGPLVGTVRKVTLANMEALADSLGPTEIACLTERRIVDALLDGASGFVIEEQQADEPLGRRLGRRNSRFATYDGAVLQTLGDGDALVLLPGLDGKPASGFTASPV